MRTHCWLVSSCHPPLPPSPVWQGCVLSLHPLVCTDSGSCHDPGARSCTGVYWTSRGLPGPTACACLGLSEWYPVRQVCWPHHTAWYHSLIRLPKGLALDPTVHVTDEDVKEHQSQYWPLRNTTCYRPLCRHWPAFSGYDLGIDSSSIQQSTHQIHMFPFWREGCYLGQSIFPSLHYPACSTLVSCCHPYIHHRQFIMGVVSIHDFWDDLCGKKKLL